MIITSPQLEELRAKRALLGNELSAIEKWERRKVEIPAEAEQLERDINAEQERVASEKARRFSEAQAPAVKAKAQASLIDQLRAQLASAELALTANLREFTSIAQNPNPRLGHIAFKPQNFTDIGPLLDSLLADYLKT